jgi:hypothetical protein
MDTPGEPATAPCSIRLSAKTDLPAASGGIAGAGTPET